MPEQREFRASGESLPGIRLVAGLGNPGREYLGTRHNIGFEVLDRLAPLLNVSFAHEEKWEALVAKGTGVGAGTNLLKPQTFMNLSGTSVCSYARFHRITPESTLVVIDDAALPLGTLRLRREGGSGGQKGLESVLVHFATERVARLRVGIGGGSSPGGDLSAHVLSGFRPEEQSAAGETVLRAAEAVLCILGKGMDHAMSLYNAAPSLDKS
jgi:peptidyl-tRNA hydrolase, PTH1 family